MPTSYILLLLACLLTSSALPVLQRGRTLTSSSSSSTTSRWCREQRPTKGTNDYIDIDTSTGSPLAKQSNALTPSPSPSPSPRKGDQGFLGGLAKLFGVDEKSQKKREAQREVNKGIDKMLAGTGIAGGLLGGVMKGVAGLMVDAFAESAQDAESINGLIERAIEADDECSELLGPGPLRLSQPYSSSSSSYSVNGQRTKTVTLAMDVDGSRATAAVQVVAANAEGGKLSLQELVLQVRPSGKVIRLVSAGGRGGSGGGGGGGGGGRGKVIDVGGAVEVM